MRYQQYAGQTRCCCHRASRQRNSVEHQLKPVVSRLGIAYIISTYPENGKGLDVASGGDVRSSAQIDQGTTSVHSTLGAIGNTLLNEILLVLAVLEHLKELVLGHFQTLERLLLFDNVVGELLQCLLIIIGDDLPGLMSVKFTAN